MVNKGGGLVKWLTRVEPGAVVNKGGAWCSG